MATAMKLCKESKILCSKSFKAIDHMAQNEVTIVQHIFELAQVSTLFVSMPSSYYWLIPQKFHKNHLESQKVK